METKKETIWKSAMTYGGMTGAVMIIYGVILYVLDLNMSQSLGLINYAILLGGIILGTKNYRDNSLGGSISYANALGYGTLVSAFAALIAAVYTYLLMGVIDPEIIEKMFTLMEEKMMEQGLADSQIEMAIEMNRKWMTPAVMTIMVIPTYTFIGFLISLFTAIFLKKEGDPFASAMQDVDSE